MCLVFHACQTDGERWRGRLGSGIRVLYVLLDGHVVGRMVVCFLRMGGVE